ncbi:MAG: methyltransferase [Clostridia bacterium]|nr:class I SAM-dependent methyltransferase [Clostridiales bacterium]MCR5805089.1 methyltransferase [Clostridia bacterium]
MGFYYDSDPTTESNRRIITYRQYGINFEFVTDTDVFSKSQVDFGTDLMISSAIRDLKERDAKVWSILDLGCGYGVVGIVMKKVFKGAEVTCVDKNKRAVGLAKENGKNNGVPLKACLESDCLSAIGDDEKFDLILTNPPVRAGKDTVFSFYEQSYEHLNEGGSIYVVLQRKQGAPSTEKKLTELFGNCETCDIKAGYRVMRSIK